MKFAEMFCGIGGFRLGLERANLGSEELQTQGGKRNRDEGTLLNGNGSKPSGEGGSDSGEFRCVWANDWDKHAAKVYRNHWDDGTLHEADIRSIPAESVPDHDLLTAGFPCQSFSVAGKRKGIQEARGTLFYEIARVAEAKRPKLLLLENVRGLLSSRGGEDFALILRVLGDLGYLLEYQILNSKHYGVPQNRERVFIVGHLGKAGGREIFPVGEACEDIDESCGEAQGEGQRLRVANTLSSRYYKDGSENLIMNLPHGFNDGWVKPLPSLGADSGSQYNELLVQPLAYLDRNQKNFDNRYMLTIDGRQSTGLRLGQRIRRLTPIECERLQGFPDRFTEGISDSQRYKCLGNAVTVPVVSFLGSLLLEAVGR